jgi:hypothetical protein
MTLNQASLCGNRSIRPSTIPILYYKCVGQVPESYLSQPQVPRGPICAVCSSASTNYSQYEAGLVKWQLLEVTGGY